MILTLLEQHYSVAVEEADSFFNKLGICFTSLTRIIHKPFRW